MRGAVVIATGGTGGHMFPAIALGDALEGRGHAVVYAVDARGARYLDPTARQVRIDAKSPTGSAVARAFAMLRLGAAMAATLARFVVARPKAVAAFGGYASVPTGMAAGVLRVPLVLHEQNAVLGRAHRLLARFAHVLALTFEATRTLPKAVRTEVVGNPVRGAFEATPLPATERLSLLVTGGSQGATIFADIVPAALAALPDDLRHRLRVVQQCRPEDLDRVRASYASSGIDATVETFFTDMPDRLAATNLAICRSGASSVAELLLVGRPAVLLPYPHAADDHQRANAEALAALGAAVVLGDDEATSDQLAAELLALLATPGRLEAMAIAAANAAKPAATDRLASLIEEAVA